MPVNKEPKPKIQITGTIEKIFVNYDRNNKEYLIIKLDQPDLDQKDGKLTIFAFTLREVWKDLTENNCYEFNVWKSEQGSLILNGFTQLI